MQSPIGELPNWLKEQLRSAPPEQLAWWAERMLDVEALESLFDEE